MCYLSTEELPEHIREKLSESAQEIYMNAYNAAYHRFAESMYLGERQNSKRLAHRIALSTVKYRMHIGQLRPAPY